LSAYCAYYIVVVSAVDSGFINVCVGGLVEAVDRARHAGYVGGDNCVRPAADRGALDVVQIRVGAEGPIQRHLMGASISDHLRRRRKEWCCTPLARVRVAPTIRRGDDIVIGLPVLNRCVGVARGGASRCNGRVGTAAGSGPLYGVYASSNTCRP